MCVVAISAVIGEKTFSHHMILIRAPLCLSKEEATRLRKTEKSVTLVVAWTNSEMINNKNRN